MQCVFCEKESSNSRSVEHIIPESLGNKKHILERGIVCDKCNNYFASKIEEPILSSIHFLNLRGRQQVETKRGTIPFQYGIFQEGRIPIALRSSPTDGLSAGAWHEKDDGKFINTLQNINRGSFFVPQSMPVNSRQLSRFIAKIGTEIFIQRAISSGMRPEQIIEIEELKAIRRFVRIGDDPKEWPINRRQIYHEDKLFSEGGERFQVLHEYKTLMTSENEIYCIICIFGEEFAVNLGGPSIEGYKRWLSENAYRSPLYSDHNT